MNRVVVFFFAGFFGLNIACGIQAAETTAQFGRFAKVSVYQPSAHPSRVVLFKNVLAKLTEQGPGKPIQPSAGEYRQFMPTSSWRHF